MTKTTKEQTQARGTVLVQVLFPIEVVANIDADARAKVVSRADYVRIVVGNELERRGKNNDTK